ncbi:unnamed protein product, partial [Closterium sp. NIES-53]
RAYSLTPQNGVSVSCVPFPDLHIVQRFLPFLKIDDFRFPRLSRTYYRPCPWQQTVAPQRATKLAPYLPRRSRRPYRLKLSKQPLLTSSLRAVPSFQTFLSRRSVQQQGKQASERTRERARSIKRANERASERSKRARAMFSSSQSTAVQLVDKATSDLLASPDWALNMQLCDLLNASSG